MSSRYMAKKPIRVLGDDQLSRAGGGCFGSGGAPPPPSDPSMLYVIVQLLDSPRLQAINDAEGVKNGG